MQDTGTKDRQPRLSRRAGVPPDEAVGGQAGEGWSEDDDKEAGPLGLEPYPLRAAAILEDAYQVSISSR